MGDLPNGQRSSRRSIMCAVEDSLRRLGTDWIDIYQVHRPRTDTNIDETLAHSPTSSTRARSAISAARLSRQSDRGGPMGAAGAGLQRFVTEQPVYSILVPRTEEDIRPPVSATAWASCPTAPDRGRPSGRRRRTPGNKP